jgi:hypothetical protein
VKFQQEIRAAIPRVVELLNDSNSDVHRATIECLSNLGAQGMHSLYDHPKDMFMIFSIREECEIIIIVMLGWCTQAAFATAHTVAGLSGMIRLLYSAHQQVPLLARKWSKTLKP